MDFLKYTALRLGLLILIFVLCMWLKLGLILSGVVGVIAAFAICYLFFPRLHVGAGRDLQRWISRRPAPQRRTRLQADAEEDREAEAARRAQGEDD